MEKKSIRGNVVKSPVRRQGRSRTRKIIKSSAE